MLLQWGVKQDLQHANQVFSGEFKSSDAVYHNNINMGARSFCLPPTEGAELLFFLIWSDLICFGFLFVF